MAALTLNQWDLNTVLHTPHPVAFFDQSERSQILCGAFSRIEEFLKSFDTIYENPATILNLQIAFLAFLQFVSREPEHEICELVANNFQETCDEINTSNREHLKARIELCELRLARLRMDRNYGMDENERRETVDGLCAGVKKLWKGVHERLEKLKVDALELRGLGVELGFVAQQGDKGV